MPTKITGVQFGEGEVYETGTYSKPSGGIPASDLAASVQTSLGKADTALQTAPVTSVNGMTGDVVITVDSALSSTSENPVQNKVIKARFDALATFTDSEDVVPLFTNQIPISTDENGSILNGVGYVENSRVKSDGSIVSANGVGATGFIPVTNQDVIRFSGFTFEAPNSNCSIAFYKSDKTLLMHMPSQQFTSVVKITDSGDKWTIGQINLAEQTGRYVITSAAAYMRLSGIGLGEGSVVTLNEEIEYGQGTISRVAIKPEVEIPQVDGLESDISDLDDRVTAIENSEGGDSGGETIDTTDPLVKYAKQIDNAAQLGYKFSSTGKKQLQFIHISDTHGSANVENAVAILNKLKADGRCSFLIHTGDIHPSTFANTAQWNTFAGYIAQATAPVLMVSGNHDVGNVSQNTTDGSTATDAQLYARMFEPYVSGWNLTSHPTGKCYWYKDFAEEGVRLIGLYDFESDYATDGNGQLLYKRGFAAYHQAQIDWFVDALLNCPAGYGVIIAKHNPMNLRGTLDNPFNGEFLQGQNTAQSFVSKDMISEIVQAFMDGTTINKTFAQTGNVTDTLTVNQSFASKNSGAHFVCYLDGHTHADGVNFLADFPNQLELNIGCDNYHYQHYSDTFNQQDTLHQDLLNYVSVDVDRGYVYIQRIGNDYTAQADRRDFTAIDYKHPPEAVDLDAIDSRVDALEDSTGASMELIRSITFSEAAALDITTDDNGQPLKLTQAILKITLGTVAANENMTVDAKNGNTSIARYYAGVKASTTGHIGTFYIWQKGGFWDSEFTSYAANGLAGIQKQAQYAMRDSVQSYPYINRIMENYSHQFPSGTVVKLFGVRYKE